MGTALLQVLRQREARVLALVGSKTKFDLCRSLGAEQADLYSSAAERIEETFDGAADVVADAIGGRIFRRLWPKLSSGGRYVLYGFAAAATGSGASRLRALRELISMRFLAPYSFVQSCRSLIGFNLSLLPARTGALRQAAAQILENWAGGRLRPIIGSRFDFGHLPEAHRALAGRATTGKIVITVP